MDTLNRLGFVVDDAKTKRQRKANNSIKALCVSDSLGRSSAHQLFFQPSSVSIFFSNCFSFLGFTCTLHTHTHRRTHVQRALASSHGCYLFGPDRCISFVCLPFFSHSKIILPSNERNKREARRWHTHNTQTQNIKCNFVRHRACTTNAFCVLHKLCSRDAYRRPSDAMRCDVCARAGASK